MTDPQLAEHPARRVLVVLADPAMRELLVQVLEDEGFSVSSAEAWAEVRQVDAPRCHLVVADSLPAEGRWPAPSLFISPLAQEWSGADDRWRGVRAVLPQPLSLERLRLAVARALGSSLPATHGPAKE